MPIMPSQFRALTRALTFRTPPPGASPRLHRGGQGGVAPESRENPRQSIAGEARQSESTRGSPALERPHEWREPCSIARLTGARRDRECRRDPIQKSALWSAIVKRSTIDGAAIGRP